MKLKIIQDFKEFAVKGNMIDIAIGVIVGAAFNKVVNVLVKEIKGNLETTDNVHINRLVKIFIKENITLLNMPKKKHRVGKIIEVYTRKYPIDSITPENLIEGVLEKLWSTNE